MNFIDVIRGTSSDFPASRIRLHVMQMDLESATHQSPDEHIRLLPGKKR